MTRRTLLQVALTPSTTPVEVTARLFVEAWNKWAAGMNAGVRDVKLELRMRKAFSRLEAELEGR